MLSSLIVALALAAVPAPAPQAGAERAGHRAQPVAPGREACAILGVVGKGQHQLDQRVAPPLRPSGTFLPACDWTGLGLRGFASRSERPNAWFSFGAPEIDGDRASVRTAIVHGPRSGHGSLCSLRRTGGRWRLERCRQTWVS